MKQFFQENNPKRHKLINDDFSQDPPKDGRRSTLLAAGNDDINTPESLKEHLQIAIEIEHSTIPPYLCALYSIKEGTNEVAAAIIRSVVVEEMLHMIMVANILNAIGGKPSINSKKFIPVYPASLPHSNNAFEVDLQKFSKDTIRTFLKIEKPSEHSAPRQPHQYNTIGQFYAALRKGLIFCEENTVGGIFIGDPSMQVTSEHYYGSGGKLTSVYSLKNALLAMDEIVGQGEGIDGTIHDADDPLFGDDIEYAHYFRFNEILHERFYQSTDTPQHYPSGKKLDVDWDTVYNMSKNPKMSNYPKGSELWEKSRSFNETYKALLDNIHRACNGEPASLRDGIALMYDLKYKAIELMKIPLENSEYSAGPTFEYLED